MENTKLHLLLADDDIDDCDFFQDAIDEISEPLNLTILNNGVQLMEFLLTEAAIHPNLIFLDLNMPKRNCWKSKRVHCNYGKWYGGLGLQRLGY